MSARGRTVPSASVESSTFDALNRAVRTFPGERLAVVSAFGPGSAVLFHLLAKLGARVPVIFVDTLHHFPETLEHVQRVRDRYDLDLRVARPAEHRRVFEAEHGPRLWEVDLERYQQLTKVAPFRTATARLDAYITGRRRDQSAARADLEVIECGTPVRINPLAHWTREDVWRFIGEHGLPYNPLHDRGYASIGDAPLTTPVDAAEPERAGRWRDTGRVECGIHVIHAQRGALE
jgi:phosphoadenosine phosphosulfate reductase